MTQQVHAPSRDMSVALQFGNLAFHMQAEGVSWSPDVADDMSKRLVGMLRDSLAEAHAYGLLPSVYADVAETDDYEDESGE